MAKTVKGIISISSIGTGYVRSEEFEEDIKIEASFLNTALHNDEVSVALFPKKKGEKQQGEVVNIIKRAKKRFVGVIEKKKNKKYAFLVPDDKRMYVDIFLPKNRVKNKSKALVEIVNWKDKKKNPEGKVIKTIGKKGENDTEINSIVLEKGLSIDFPGKVEKEAKDLKKKIADTKNRKDFSNAVTFTIDPEDAKDFDDALSVRKIEDDLYEVGVHIADVSNYVKEKTELDKEAQKRAFSIYLVDRTIPMLPEVLSNDICSLKEKEERVAFSAVFKIKKNGDIVERWFGETVIFSDKRFTYKEAQEVLDKKKGKFLKELSFLAEIAKNLRKERIKNGALMIEDDELFFKLDHDGRPISVYRKEHFFTHNLVEELMILANREVAKRFKTLYRVHDKPDKETIDNLLTFLSNLGYKVRVEKKDISSTEINKLFKDIKGKNEEFLVKSAVLRSMAKAEYSIKNKKHFGLALDEYMHFTSPIRRYADLLMHRIVKKKLRGEKINPKRYEDVAREISFRELDVLDAERNSIAYKQVEYMLNKVGEEFDAIIAGVTNFGFFVQEIETKAEGMVSIRDMDDDYYIFDEENYSLIGTRKRKRYSLGDKIRVRLVGGNIEARQLDFTIPKK